MTLRAAQSNYPTGNEIHGGADSAKQEKGEEKMLRSRALVLCSVAIVSLAVRFEAHGAQRLTRSFLLNSSAARQKVSHDQQGMSTPRGSNRQRLSKFFNSLLDVASQTEIGTHSHKHMNGSMAHVTSYGDNKTSRLVHDDGTERTYIKKQEKDGVGSFTSLMLGSDRLMEYKEETGDVLSEALTAEKTYVQENDTESYRTPHVAIHHATTQPNGSIEFTFHRVTEEGCLGPGTLCRVVREGDRTTGLEGFDPMTANQVHQTLRELENTRKAAWSAQEELESVLTDLNDPVASARDYAKVVAKIVAESRAK